MLGQAKTCQTWLLISIVSTNRSTVTSFSEIGLPVPKTCPRRLSRSLSTSHQMQISSYPYMHDKGCAPLGSSISWQSVIKIGVFQMVFMSSACGRGGCQVSWIVPETAIAYPTSQLNAAFTRMDFSAENAHFIRSLPNRLWPVQDSSRTRSSSRWCIGRTDRSMALIDRRACLIRTSAR